MTIAISGEKGRVIGIAHYISIETQYQVEYKDAMGCRKTEWFFANSLEK